MIGLVMPMRLPLVYSDVPANINLLLRSRGYQVAMGVASTTRLG